MESESREQLRRAPRFSLRIPLRYRASGEPIWREGRTENISRSGVLFRTECAMPPLTVIDMLMALPIGVADGDSATVICRGRIVRAEPGNRDDPQPAVAATISAYRLAHAQRNDPRRI